MSAANPLHDRLSDHRSNATRRMHVVVMVAVLSVGWVTAITDAQDPVPPALIAPRGDDQATETPAVDSAGGSLSQSESAEPAQELLVPPAPTGDSDRPLPLPMAQSQTTSGCSFACQTDYWIISTRRCPQQTDSGLCCLPDVYHVDARGRMRSVSMDVFVETLDPNRPVTFMTHGSFVDWQSMLADSRRTFNWLQCGCVGSLQVVFFTWPSDEFQTPFVGIDVQKLGWRSAVNGFYLARTLAELRTGYCVTLIGHSHGARVTASALHLLGGGTIGGFRLGVPVVARHRLRAVFAAAALDHHWLNPDERYNRAITRVECLVNLTNDRDAALLIYPLRRPFSSRAFGQTGLTSKDRRKLGWWSARVREIDVSSLIKAGHIWPHYYRQPQIARQIAPYLVNWPQQ